MRRLLFGLFLTILSTASLATPDREFDANNCEFFVNSFGLEHRHYSGGGYDEDFVVSYLSINTKDLVEEQGGQILQVGMRTNGVDDITVMQPLESSYYVLYRSIMKRGYQSSDYLLTRFAYFVDVRRQDGFVDRLWLKDGWHDFGWPESYEPYSKVMASFGSSSASYVEGPSTVFNQRQACRHN